MKFVLVHHLTQTVRHYESVRDAHVKTQGFALGIHQHDVQCAKTLLRQEIEEAIPAIVKDLETLAAGLKALK